MTMLNVDTKALTAQGTQLHREILLSTMKHNNANRYVTQARESLTSFNAGLKTTRAKLEDLLSKVQSTIRVAETQLNALATQANTLSSRISSTQSSLSAANSRLQNLASAQSQNPSDAVEQDMHRARRDIEQHQNNIASLNNDLRENRTQTNRFNQEIAALRDVEKQVFLELVECNRLATKVFIALVNINLYNDTRGAFLIIFARARELADALQGLALDMSNTDAAGALILQKSFIDQFSSTSSLVESIIAIASSQIGVRETSNDFVAGKPYAQEGVAWCGDFVRWVIEESGIELSDNDRDALASTYRVARAWAVHGADGGGYGRPATQYDAQPGDILIDRYNGSVSPGGHVSIIVETGINGNPNLVRTVGGNESNQVQTEIKDLSKNSRYMITLAELNN